MDVYLLPILLRPSRLKSLRGGATPPNAVPKSIDDVQREKHDLIISGQVISCVPEIGLCSELDPTATHRSWTTICSGSSGCKLVTKGQLGR